MTRWKHPGRGATFLTSLLRACISGRPAVDIKNDNVAQLQSMALSLIASGSPRCLQPLTHVPNQNITATAAWHTHRHTVGHTFWLHLRYLQNSIKSILLQQCSSVQVMTMAGDGSWRPGTQPAGCMQAMAAAEALCCTCAAPSHTHSLPNIPGNCSYCGPGTPDTPSQSPPGLATLLATACSWCCASPCRHLRQQARAHLQPRHRLPSPPSSCAWPWARAPCQGHHSPPPPPLTPSAEHLFAVCRWRLPQPLLQQQCQKTCASSCHCPPQCPALLR
jgi:hypothetical protein